jgi:hypothetical protein
MIERCVVCCRDFLCSLLLPSNLPGVLYLVRYETGQRSCFELRNAYLHVGKTLPNRNEEIRHIFFREVAFCKGMLLIEKESFFRLRNATPCE